MRRLFLIFTILSCFLVSGQTRISGIVKDKITREPLAGASVFVPNTTNGGATDENGFFSFTLRENQLELLISYIGYESVMVPTASFAATDKNNVLYLSPSVNTIKEVVVTKMDPKERKRHLETFKREFIGLGEIALKTKILNPEVLQFETRKEHSSLVVTAYEPVILVNEKTGYEISYELVYFESRTVPEDSNQKLTTYIGYPFFKDITVQKKLNPEKIAKARAQCYQGSSMHFIRSLYNNTCDKEGFRMQKFTRLLNNNYPTAEQIQRMKYDAIMSGTPFRYPQKYTTTFDNNPCSVNDLVFEKEGKKHLYFPDCLSVVYTKEGEESNYSEFTRTKHPKEQFSRLELLKNQPIEIYANGNYANPEELGNFGYMGWKKMGEMLPFDYQPEAISN